MSALRIGRPGRFSAIANLRKALDAHLDTLMSPSLTTQAARTAAGLRERWTWDVVRPWIAVAIGVAGPALALWLGTPEPAIEQAMAGRRAPAIPFGGARCALGEEGVRAVDHVDAGVARSCAPLDQVGRRGHRLVSSRLAVVGRSSKLGAWTGSGVYRRDRRPTYPQPRIASRMNASGDSIRSRKPVDRVDMECAPETGCGGRRAARVVAARRQLAAVADRRSGVWALIAVLVLVPGLPPALVSTRWLLVSTLTALFAAKAWWLSVLVGWPGEAELGSQDYKRIAAFRAFVPLVAFVALPLLTSFTTFQELTVGG